MSESGAGGRQRHFNYSNVMSTLAVFLVIAGGTAIAAQLPKNSVGTKQLKKNAVVAKKVKPGAIKTAKLGDAAVTTGKIADGNVFNEDLAADSVSAAKIGGGAVGSEQLADRAVSAPKLAPPEDFRSDGFLWPAYAPTWSQPGYYRDPYGRVHLRGMVKAGVNSRILELPSGYRPSASTNMLFMVPAGDVMRRIDIDPAGVVRGNHTDPAQQAWLSLDGVSFRCAPSGSDGCP